MRTTATSTSNQIECAAQLRHTDHPLAHTAQHSTTAQHAPQSQPAAAAAGAGATLAPEGGAPQAAHIRRACCLSHPSPPQNPVLLAAGSLATRKHRQKTQHATPLKATNTLDAQSLQRDQTPSLLSPISYQLLPNLPINYCNCTIYCLLGASPQSSSGIDWNVFKSSLNELKGAVDLLLPARPP